MKKKVVTERVLKAISLGISATLAMSPLTAAAADPDKSGTEPDGIENPESQKTDVEKVQAVAEKATETEIHTDTAETAEAKVIGTVDGFVEQGIVDDEDVIAESDNLDQCTTTEGVNDVSTKMDDTKADLADAEAAATEAEQQIAEADTKTNDADDAVNEAVEAIQNAIEEVEKQQGNLDSATTKEEGKAAVDAAQAATDEGNAKYDAAKSDYDQAVTDYNAAMAALTVAQNKYDEALVKAVGNEEITGDVETAKKELEDAKSAADDLHIAAQSAAEKYATEAAKQLAIAEMESKAETNDWYDRDKLFTAIMRDYYVPNVLNATDVKVEKFTKSRNNDFNFCKISYTDADDNKVVRYFNYKIDPISKNLIIFEKNEVEVETKAEVLEHYETAGEGDAVLTLTPEEVAAMVADGTVVKVDDRDMMKTSEGDTVNEDVDGEVSNTEEGYSIDENGKLVKKVIGDVTRTVYDETELQGGDGFASRDAAEAAAKDELQDGDKDLDVEYSKETEAEATLSFVTTYTSSMDLKGIKGLSKDIIEAGIERGVKNYLEDNDYEVVDLQIRGLATKKSGFMQRETTAGILTVTYAKTKSVKVDQWLYEAILRGDENAKRQAYSKIENLYEVVDVQTFNWSLGKATVVYVEGDTVTAQATVSGDLTDDTKATAEAAAREAAVQKAQDKADSSIISSTAQAIWKAASDKSSTNQSAKTTAAAKRSLKGGNVTGADAEVTSETTYGYEGSYQKQGTETEENVLLSTTTWDASELEHIDHEDAETEMQYIGNAAYEKYLEGDDSEILLFEETDEQFREWIQSAQDKLDAYDQIAEEAKSAKQAADEALQEMLFLDRQIRSLQGLGGFEEEIAQMESKLAVAELKFRQATEDKKALDEKLDETLEDYRKLVEEIDREEERQRQEEEDRRRQDEENRRRLEEEANRRRQEEENRRLEEALTIETIEIEDNDTPLAEVIPVVPDTIEEPTEDEEVIALDETESEVVAPEVTPEVVNLDEEEPEVDAITIADEETALAVEIKDEEKISWWWLLLIAVLGATGYEMYKKHQQKKQAVEKNSEEK